MRCFVCEGSGRVWAGPRDPIEGNKLRPTVECPAGCRGGVVREGSPLHAACVAYEERREEIRRAELERRIQAQHQREYLVRSALSKLTEDEISALRTVDGASLMKLSTAGAQARAEEALP